MAKTDVWVRAGEELIRSDRISGVSRRYESLHLKVSGLPGDLAINVSGRLRVGPYEADGTYLRAMEAFEAKAEVLDVGLLQAIAQAAKAGGGYLVSLNLDPEIVAWQITDLAPDEEEEAGVK